MRERSFFRFGRFELRPTQHVLLEHGLPVRLTPKVFDTLAALVRRHGSVVTREELIQEVWPDTFVEEGGLTQNISILRKLLHQPNQPPLIETVPRRGYRFAGGVEEVGSGRDEDVRIAVLPFISVSAAAPGDPPDLADGLAADVIDALAAIKGVRVAAFSTVARFQGDVDPLRVARDLRVDAVVTGRLRMRDGYVSLDAELVDADDGTRLWARRYDCGLDRLASIPQQAAVEIGGAIGAGPAPGDAAATAPRNVPHPDAYADYLAGRHHLAHRTMERVERAIEKFERAIARDGDYAPAYAGLAQAYTLAASAEYGGRTVDAMARAKAAAMRAVGLDPDLAQAHASLALMHFRLDWNWALAEAEFGRALALNPRDADVHHAFAFYLIAMERRAEACAEASEAYRLQPVSLIVATGLGRIFHFAGDDDRAVEQLERVRDLEPSFAQVHLDLSFVQAAGGRLHDAIESCGKAIALAPGRPVCSGVLGNYLARAGRRAEARTILSELERLVAAQQASPFDLALVHAGLGDNDRAVDALAAACRERHGLLVYLRVERLWNPLRDDPRFNDLLRQIGLVQRF